MMSPFSNEFEYFLILAQTQNISRAAELTGIKQSGLSKALQKVEAKWGAKLFSRSKKGIELTREGLRAVKIISELKKNWESSWRATDHTEILGLIKIGAHPSIAQNSFARFYGQIVERYPALNLDLVFDRSLTITRKVINAELDFGVVVNPHRHPELVILQLRKESVCACKSLKSKKTQKIVFYNPEMIDVHVYLRAFVNHQHVAIADYITIATILRETQCIGILPMHTAELMGGLCSTQELTSAVLCLIYRKDRSQNKAMQAVIREVKIAF